MSYLICINEKTGEILHPEVVKLSDTLSLLDDKELMYVVLFTDYNSIYKQFPEHERRRRAMWHAFNENETELIESPRILMAIQDYTSLQYNPDIELIRRFQAKIDRLLELLDKDDTSIGIEKTTKAINSLRKNISDLQEKVTDQTKSEGVIKGDRLLSFLEKAISNKKLYKSLIKER